jgi:pSer/pThr/pTyr-binding forkhead associated (FHA) protein
MPRAQELQLVFRELAPGKKGEQTIDIAPNQWVTIGRSPDCDYTRKFVNGAVSRVHLTLSRNEDDSWIVIDGAPDHPSENGIFNKAGQRLVTHTPDGKLSKPIRLAEPGDVIYLVPTNDKKEQAYLQVIDLNAPTDNNPTFRLEQQVADAHQQSVTNHQLISEVKAATEKQSQQLTNLAEAIKGAKMTAEFIDSVSADTKKFIRGAFASLIIIAIFTFGKVLVIDGGAKQILDYWFPPHKEQKK